MDGERSSRSKQDLPNAGEERDKVGGVEALGDGEDASQSTQDQLIIRPSS